MRLILEKRFKIKLLWNYLRSYSEGCDFQKVRCPKEEIEEEEESEEHEEVTTNWRNQSLNIYFQKNYLLTVLSTRITITFGKSIFC